MLNILFELKNWVYSCAGSLCVIRLRVALVLKSYTLQGSLVPPCKYSIFDYVFKFVKSDIFNRIEFLNVQILGVLLA